MPVILNTQRSLNRPSPWSRYTFPGEVSKTKETPVPKFKVKYAKVTPQSVINQTTQTQVPPQTEEPANVYEPSAYSPLVISIPPPPLLSPSTVGSISPIPSPIQNILQQFPASSNQIVSPGAQSNISFFSAASHLSPPIVPGLWNRQGPPKFQSPR